MTAGISRAVWAVALGLAAACGGDDDEGAVPLACAADEDRGNDGTVDVRWTYSYDEHDRITLEEGDYPGVGEAVDERWVWEYDGRGNNTLLEWYQGDALAYRSRFVYDGDDNLTREEYDYDGNGLDLRTTHSYQGGLLLTTERDDRTATGEAGPDGIADSRTTFAHEGDRVATASIDSDADGTPDQIDTYVYEGDLLIAIEGRYPDLAEVISMLTTFQYDAEGREIERVIDYNNDGEFNLRFSTIYDEAGRLIEYHYEYGGIFSGGFVRFRLRYGDDGRLLEMELTGDIIDEYTLSYQYECAASRVASAAQVRQPADGLSSARLRGPAARYLVSSQLVPQWAATAQRALAGR
jgi:hypothetical protein